VAIVVWLLVVKGTGDQLMNSGLAAEPDGVTEIVARVLPHTAWTALITNKGAGVIVVVMTLFIGEHEPGGFILSV
jgi:hypothetical protein